MNSIEKYIFEQHMKNLDTRFEDFSREVMANQTADTFSIVYATDVHYIRKYAPYVAAYQKLCEMVDFTGFAGVDLLALGGDTVDGNTTLKRQYRDLYDVMGVLKRSKSTSVAVVKGNHDECEWYAYQKGLGVENVVTEEEWFTHVLNPLRVQYPMSFDEDNICGGYFSIDYPFHKIRVIGLNTNDVPCVLDENGIISDRTYCSHWCLGLREKQLKWLVKKLSIEEEGWSVLFLSHDFLLDYDGKIDAVPHNGNNAWEIIKAFKNGQKGKVTNNEKYFETEVEYDFTKNKSNDVLPYIFGHCHMDNSFTVDGITMVSSKNVLHCDSTQWDRMDEKIDGGWDCILIDKKKRTFKTFRYGVEEANRVIEY